MKYEGINPAELSEAVLGKLPKGARLLESDLERIAFEGLHASHTQLWAYNKDHRRWIDNCMGTLKDVTYCTTLPKGWWKKQEVKVQPTQGDDGTVRQFATGATRDTATNKPDYDGYLSPYVIEAYGAYMLKHQVQSDGSLRASDNWQKGIPQDVYRKSSFRHYLAFWKHARRNKKLAKRDALALLFNVMGWLHEQLKPEEK